jgi:hypothetical protein
MRYTVLTRFASTTPIGRNMWEFSLRLASWAWFIYRLTEVATKFRWEAQPNDTVAGFKEALV